MKEAPQMEEFKRCLGKKVRISWLVPTKVDWAYVDEETNTPLPLACLDPKREEVFGVLEAVQWDAYREFYICRVEGKVVEVPDYGFDAIKIIWD